MDRGGMPSIQNCNGRSSDALQVPTTSILPQLSAQLAWHSHTLPHLYRLLQHHTGAHLSMQNTHLPSSRKHTTYFLLQVSATRQRLNWIYRKRAVQGDKKNCKHEVFCVSAPEFSGCNRNKVDSCFLQAYILWQNDISSPCYFRKRGLSNQNETVWSWPRHNSSTLPLRKRKDEKDERTQLLVVWTKNGETKKEEIEKFGLPPPICHLCFFIGLNVRTELTSDFLYLPLLFFPVIHGYPRSFLGWCSVQCFLLLLQLTHNIHLFT